MVNKKLQLAGYTDANGDLGRPVPSGRIIVPGQVWVEGDSIRWKLWGHTKVREPSRAMLNEFLALHQANSSDAFLKFARQWGVLVLTGGKIPRPCGEAMPEGIEPIEAWKYFSRRASAVLNIAAALKEGKLGDLADWGVIATPQSGDEALDTKAIKAAFDRHKYGMNFLADIPRERPQAVPRRSAVDQGRDLLVDEIGQWLSFWKAERMRGLSDFSLRWSSRAQKWELQIDYHGFLFAAIALQLALVVADADSLFTCSGCGRPYIREKKRPKTGWANYCDQCTKRGVAGRRAVENYREKQAEARRLASEGIPIGDIAAKLNTKPASVKNWLKNWT